MRLASHGQHRVAYANSDPRWVSRAGSIMVLLGVMIAARHVVRVGVAEWKHSLRHIDYGSWNPTPEEMEKDRQEGLDAKAERIVGPAVAIPGTIIWGYGDVIWAWFV